MAVHQMKTNSSSRRPEASNARCQIPATPFFSPWSLPFTSCVKGRSMISRPPPPSIRSISHSTAANKLWHWRPTHFGKQIHPVPSIIKNGTSPKPWRTGPKIVPSSSVACPGYRSPGQKAPAGVRGRCPRAGCPCLAHIPHADASGRCSRPCGSVQCCFDSAPGYWV